MALHETQPSNKQEAIEGIVVSELPAQLRETTSAPHTGPQPPNVAPDSPPARPRPIIPIVMLPPQPNQQPRLRVTPPQRVNPPTSRAMEPVFRQPATAVLAPTPPQPTISRELPLDHRGRGKGVVYALSALLLAGGAVAAHKLTDQDNPKTFSASASSTPGAEGNLLPPVDIPDQPAEPLPEPADLSFLSVSNVAAEPSSTPVKPTPALTNSPDVQQPITPVVPNVFPTTVETTPPAATTVPTPKPSTKPTKATPSPVKTAEQKPPAEVKIPVSPSMESIKLINSSINENYVRQLDKRYENFSSNLDLEQLARNGELDGLDASAIRRNQQLIIDMYGRPGVKDQIGRPKTLSEDSLRAMLAANTSPATRINSHADTLLRNANLLYPLIGNDAVKAAVINDTLVSQLTQTLANDGSLSVPFTENATVVEVRTARLSQDVTAAFVAVVAEDNDHQGVELRWSVLEQINQANDFVATTVWSKQLKPVEEPQTPPPAEDTPAPTYSETTEPTPDTTQPTETDQTNTPDPSERQGDNRDNRYERRRDRNS